jgi:hypothetical protein
MDRDEIVASHGELLKLVCTLFCGGRASDAEIARWRTHANRYWEERHRAKHRRLDNGQREVCGGTGATSGR